jgi:hypothetical protein
MLLITIFVELRVVAGRSQMRAGLSMAVLCRGLEKDSMVRAWHGRGRASVNQTQPHCVKQMGKTHSKPLVARHECGMGTACYVWIGLNSAAVTRIEAPYVALNLRCLYTRLNLLFYCKSCGLLNVAYLIIFIILGHLLLCVIRSPIHWSKESRKRVNELQMLEINRYRLIWCSQVCASSSSYKALQPI